MNDITFRDLQKGFRELGLNASSRVIAHTSLSAFGHVRGGAEAMVGALTSVCGLVAVPTFTYQCLISPLVGPENNGMTYRDRQADNEYAEMFQPDVPAHADMGLTAETLRHLPGAVRSSHPLLSFAAVGLGAEAVTSAQTLGEPLGPIGRLAAEGGDVLLLGVDHTKNTSIHYAERRAGRRQFTRWALTPVGVVQCPNWPGCSAGFNAVTPHVAGFTRTARIGAATVQRLPLGQLLQTVELLIRNDPLALLCDNLECERCNAVRASPLHDRAQPPGLRLG
jgi:aminoglycoside 3-N-acetyltransferase